MKPKLLLRLEDLILTGVLLFLAASRLAPCSAVSAAMSPASDPCPFSRRGRVFWRGVRFFFFENGRELLSSRGEFLEGVSPPPPFNPAEKIIFNFLSHRQGRTRKETQFQNFIVCVTNTRKSLLNQSRHCIIGFST
jgi:hypothetical protein